MGFEPTTSAESLVYGYLHALLNFLIPQFWSVFPMVIDSGARRHSFLGPSVLMGLARLRPRWNEGSMQRPTERRVSEILGIKLSRNTRDSSGPILLSGRCTFSSQAHTILLFPGNGARNRGMWIGRVTRRGSCRCMLFPRCAHTLPLSLALWRLFS